MLSADDAADLTDEESLLLATLPRLSTRSEASSVSGRGVGLDVVRERLKSIGGFVEIRSEPGRGCELHLSVPLRRALIQTLLLRCSGELYAVPLDAVIKIVDFEQLKKQQSETPTLRQVDLRQRLGLPAGPSRGAPKRALLLAAAEPPAALVVEEVLGRQDLVAQPLHAPLAHRREYSGAALLEDGTIVPILDPLFLVRG